MNSRTVLLQGTGLCCHFDGQPQPLFQNVDVSLGSGTQFLTGRNGVGKSLLAAMLAGQRKPDGGLIVGTSPGYLPQTRPEYAGTAAGFLGVDKALQAHERILAGDGSVEDYEVLNERWDLASDVGALLQSVHLPPRILWQPFGALSGGERTRLALLALRLAGHDLVILDEPSNHLDRDGRRWLADWIETFAGVLVISHDRPLLERAQTVFELDAFGLQQHRGGWSDYLRSREQLRLGALRDEERSLARLREAKRAQTAHAESSLARRNHAQRQRACTNQSKMILDRNKETSDQSLARNARLHAERHTRSVEELFEARERIERLDPLAFTIAPPLPVHGPLLWLHEVQLPFGRPQPLSLSLLPGDRAALVGPNGCGKSTLLKLVTGSLAPVRGDITVTRHVRMLDQQCALLDPARNALENFASLAPGWTQDRYRTVLAQLRLRGGMALMPVAQLSGGERIKVALATLFCGPSSPSLLLLDEPDNHLDLESRELLESALARYEGGILMVSHDPSFVRNARVGRVIDLQATEPIAQRATRVRTSSASGR